MKPVSLIGRAAVFAAASLATVGCKSFLDVNTSPNNPVTVPPATQLPTIIIGSGFVVGNTLGRDADLFMQHYAGIANQPQTEDRYAISGNYNNEWQGDLYTNNLNGAQTLITSTQATSPAYSGIAKLIKAYNFSLLTDLWGDVPYSQALQGLTYIHPVFDKQQDIYQGATGIQSLFDLVRDGLADLDKTSILKPGAADDLAYKGDLSKWKRVGNMLLLKFACTISYKNPTLARTVINEVLQKGANGSAAIFSNDDDFQVPFFAAVGNTNPYYSYNVTYRLGDQMASSRFLDSLAAFNDPRIARYFTATPNNATPTATTAFGKFTGFNNGNTTALPAVANRSVYNTYVFGTAGEAPVRLLTNFQRDFILAEMAIKLGTAGDANALYQDGIRQSMIKTGLSATDVNTYFAANPSIVTLRGSDTYKISQIIRQKWFATIGGQGIESWIDYRRTGFPRLQPALNAVFTPNIPQRLLYPSSETAANGSNVPTTGVSVSDKVWWASY